MEQEIYDDRAKEAAKLLGIRTEQFEQALSKHVSLKGSLPNTINNNIENTAKLLGITKAQMVQAALKHPSLLTQLPETLNNNIETTAKLLGITKTQMVQAALKQPPLFYQSPETIYRNMRYIKNAKNQGYILSNNILTDLLKKPMCFSLAPRNTHLRSIDASIHKTQKPLTAFFSAAGSNKKQVEERILNHYQKQINRTGKGIRTLQILAETGIISKLPDGIPAPDQPLRQRDRTASPATPGL